MSPKRQYLRWDLNDGGELTMWAGGSGGVPGGRTAYAKVRRFERSDRISDIERAV